jgi:hypothetical protein
VVEGRRFDETTFISRDEDTLRRLAWPKDIAGFYPVDFSWSGKTESEDENAGHDDTVILYTLLPVKITKAKVKPADVQANRKAKWGKFLLKF